MMTCMTLIKMGLSFKKQTLLMMLSYLHVLAQAQAAAVEAEKRADASKKQQKSYKGNSR